MAGEPPGELRLVFDLDQLDGVLLVDLGQGEGMRRGGGIGGVDPIDERLSWRRTSTWASASEEIPLSRRMTA